VGCSDGEEVKIIMNLRRRLRSESVTDASLLSPPSSAAQLLAGNSSADTESSMGAESESEWTYLLTTDDQLNQSIRKEFYYDHVRTGYCFTITFYCHFVPLMCEDICKITCYYLFC